MNDTTIKGIILNYLNEDVGDGDHTSLATIKAGTLGKAQLLVKQNGIIAGVDVARQVFDLVDPALKTEFYFADGDAMKVGDVAFLVEGSVHSILKAERLVLNFMQRMSAIATQTRQIVDLLKGTRTRVLDTRKTTPGFRYFEKLAVKIGGGVNHRIGLYDMILIKDNHVDYSGGVKNAIINAQQYLEQNHKTLAIEIEVRNFTELNEALAIGGMQRIMLDNFSVADLQQAVDLIAGKLETEASGGITIDNIRQYAETGVDFISVGALTHSVKSLDLSLKAVNH